MKPTPLARIPWSRLLHPRIAIAAMLASTLLAGLAMQHSIDRLESAAQARAHLERQSADLHERYQPTAAASPAPAMQQLRAEYDATIVSAASLGRWTAWAALAWMLALGGASAWALRRAKQAGAPALPDLGTPQAGPAASTAPSPFNLTATSTATSTPPCTPTQPTARADWAVDLADIAREMRAVSALIGSDAVEPIAASCVPTPATVARDGSVAPCDEPLATPAAPRAARVISLLDDDVDEPTAPGADAAASGRWSFPARSALGLRLAA